MFHLLILLCKRDVGSDEIIGREHVYLFVVLVLHLADSQSRRFRLNPHDPAQGLFYGYFILFHIR